MADRAKIFKNGRSQAVRLPKEYRFKGTEIRIWKSGKRVILEPIEREEWPEDFWQMFDKDDTFPLPEPLPGTSFGFD